jgi:hypothetical protein
MSTLERCLTGQDVVKETCNLLTAFVSYLIFVLYARSLIKSGKYTYCSLWQANKWQFRLVFFVANLHFLGVERGLRRNGCYVIVEFRQLLKSIDTDDKQAGISMAARVGFKKTPQFFSERCNSATDYDEICQDRQDHEMCRK